MCEAFGGNVKAKALEVAVIPAAAVPSSVKVSPRITQIYVLPQTSTL